MGNEGEEEVTLSGPRWVYFSFSRFCTCQRNRQPTP